MGNDDVAPTFDFSKGKLTGVTIDASAAGIAKKAYTGEVRLPKGTEAPTDGSMPKVLLMTLPASYNGGVTRLTYDEESGMYLSRNKDMKFELKLGDGGKVTLTAVKDDALAKLRSENLQKWQGVKGQEESKKAEQVQQQEKQQSEEVVAQKTEAGKKLAKDIKEQLKHDWSPKDARAKLETINNLYKIDFAQFWHFAMSSSSGVRCTIRDSTTFAPADFARSSQSRSHWPSPQS